MEANATLMVRLRHACENGSSREDGDGLATFPPGSAVHARARRPRYQRKKRSWCSLATPARTAPPARPGTASPRFPWLGCPCEGEVPSLPAKETLLV